MKRPTRDLQMPLAENNARTADTMRSTPGQARSCQPTTAHGIVRGHVVATVRILREYLADPWTLDALADEAHLSRSQLVRSFDATVGVSPMAYLRPDAGSADGPTAGLNRPVDHGGSTCRRLDGPELCQPLLSQRLRRLAHRVPPQAGPTTTGELRD
jgi:hypothetical protein